MGELQAATESVSPVIALIFPFLPVLILLGFYFAAGGGFNDDDDDDFGGGTGNRILVPVLQLPMQHILILKSIRVVD